jgi:hypothetical protein
MKTERMTVLLTREQKAAILARASSLGMSTGEMVRRAVETYQPASSGALEDEVVLNALADELFTAAKSARAALVDANKNVQATVTALAVKRKRAYGGL